MGQTYRERAQRATREAIKATARGQMARAGAAALSLRAVAAEMGLTAPALYRYYRNRDDLITALIIDAFDAIGDTIAAAAARCDGDDYAGQFVAMMAAYRDWALTHRADFALVYGTPLPDYDAPAEATDAAVRRSTAPLLALLVRAWRAGRTATPPAEALPATLREHFVAFAARELGAPVPPALLHDAVAAWAHLQGLIMLDLFGHLAPAAGDPAAFYDLAVRAEVARLGLRAAD